MSLYNLILVFYILSGSVHPFLVEVPTPLVPEKTKETTAPQEPQGDPWSEMTVIKTHYDCHGLPMWREVSKIRSRVGEVAQEVKTSMKPIHATKGGSSTSEGPMFFHSMGSRFRNTRPRPAAPSSALSTTTQRPRPQGLDRLEVGPDRIIETPIISCPEGYNEDYHGRCRPVFPEFM